MLDPIATRKLPIEEIKRLNQELLDKEQRGEALTTQEQQDKQVLFNAYQAKLEDIQHQDVEDAARHRRESERLGRTETPEREPFWFRKAW